MSSWPEGKLVIKSRLDEGVSQIRVDMVFDYVFFYDSRKNRGNGNGAILIGLDYLFF